ncbi:MAG: hypothetical protein HY038_09375 [Nitrospirae bacterium]|nr:hypothetical protein [Nitrospirota bacterium]
MKGASIGSMLFLIIPAIAVASSVELIAFKDKAVCEKVAKFIGDKLMLDSELLKTVEWKPVELKGQGPKTRHCSSLDKSLVDLDNDGQQDVVVKTSFCMKGAPSDSFYMFPADSNVLEQGSWQDLAPLLATTDKFERTGGTYPFTSLPMENPPPALTTLFAIQLFQLDHSTYVSLTDARREWMVIAKYLRGERFEDQCYVRTAGR